MVDAEGHNLIATAAGSNRRLSGQIPRARSNVFTAPSLLTQLEIPLETVEYGLRRAAMQE